MAKQKKSMPDITSQKSKRADSDRRINQAERMVQILKILELIQGNGRWNVTALAQEFGCSEQTIYRQLRVLEYAGVPYYYDKIQQCYRVRFESRFPVLHLSPDEILGQAIATSATQAPGLDISPGATPTTQKLAAKNDNTHEILSDAENLISVLGLQLADHSQHHDIIRTLQWALLEGKQLSGRYRSPYEEQDVTLHLTPYRLCLVKNAWYVVGKASQFEEVRSFRVARFKTLRMLETPAHIPEEFDLEEYFGNAWAVYRGDQSYDVKLKFTPSAALIVTETNWHHTQEVEHHKDGSVTLSFTVDGLDEILNWILGWTGRVVIQEPADLKQLYYEKLEQGLEMNTVG